MTVFLIELGDIIGCAIIVLAVILWTIHLIWLCIDEWKRKKRRK